MSEQTPKEMAINAIEEAAREKAKSLALKNLDEIPQQLGNLRGQDALTVQGGITSYQVNGGTPTILLLRP